MSEIQIKDIETVIEGKVNPQLKFHQGKCELVEWNGGVLRVKILGGCSGCPSSSMALYQQVSDILQEEIPELTDIRLAHI